MPDVLNPAFVDPSLDSRAVTFENPTGARGAGGTAHHGRKGAPNKRLAAGETVVLADLDGPGTLRHFWMTFMPAPPEVMRAVWIEVFYDGATEPSVSVPCLDFFGMPLGRPVPYSSAMTSAQEGRGFNTYFPMPFAEHVRVELTNSSERSVILYYQIDYTLEPKADNEGYLHVSFRRENPTTLKEDFVIADGLAGPGRFLGCNIGIRVIDPANWYGEGELKIYRDGDDEYPTICGTGLEDYIGSAWGLGRHHGYYAGAPLIVGPQAANTPDNVSVDAVDYVGFYRWHLHDPVMFASDLKVAIQQIGAKFFLQGQEADLAEYEKTNPVAGEGWVRSGHPSLLAWGICERVDDFCATAYVYCERPQPVPRLDISAAIADIDRKEYEQPHPSEALALAVSPE